MSDLFSRGILLGLGAAIAGKEKLEETIMKMAEQGTMSKNEAESLFNDLVRKGAQKSESWNQDIRNSIKTQLKELGFVTKDEFDTLQAQIVLLQKELAEIRSKDSGHSGTTTAKADAGSGLSSAGSGIGGALPGSGIQGIPEGVPLTGDEEQTGFTGSLNDTDSPKTSSDTGRVHD
ncbi:hypothetical protein DRW41_09135 [Neobacillus piezotolerans]|uniref:Polyhydroxyalkanoate synthesis regulator n=1 Tax=Neobacillus piezotolerans TaxID=2259171 RepID=A0A3D8GR02_9BACI|nr:hypothetical protein [Neobacillus piezotolerans]RDU36858.1 hypothetical protein DRW41_09135 [Neobacillus piezotolerans]